MKKIEHQKTQVQHKNPYWEYRVDDFKFPDGRDGKYYYVFTHGSTFVIPILDSGRIVMVEQYRYLNQNVSIEFPGGGQVESISHQENALKELKEETGYSAKHIDKIGVYNPYNGVTSEIARIYVAKGLKAGETNFDDSEDINVVDFSIEEIEEMIRSNKIWDGMSLAAWALFEKTKYYGDKK